MKEKLSKKLDELEKLSAELGRLHAAHATIGYDTFISPGVTITEKIYALEIQVRELKEEVLALFDSGIKSNNKLSVKVKCPYCESWVKLDLEPGFHKVLCYPEDGGCDSFFAIDLALETKYKTYELEYKTYELEY